MRRLDRGVIAKTSGTCRGVFGRLLKCAIIATKDVHAKMNEMNFSFSLLSPVLILKTLPAADTAAVKVKRSSWTQENDGNHLFSSTTTTRLHSMAQKVTALKRKRKKKKNRFLLLLLSGLFIIALLQVFREFVLFLFLCVCASSFLSRALLVKNGALLGFSVF